MHLPNGICVKTLPLAGERQGDTADHRRAHDSRVWVKGYRLKVKGKVNTTNRPCEAVGVNEANGFPLPIVLLLEIAQIEKDLPGGFVGFVHLVVMLNLPLVIDRSLRLLS